MLLLWKEGIAYWKVGLGYALVGIGVGFAGTPASHSLTGSVPVRRAGMASATADLQRDLGGAIMQSIFGALLTAGYAAAQPPQIGGCPRQAKVSESQKRADQVVLERRRHWRPQYPPIRAPIIAAAKNVLPRRATTGPTAPGSSRSCSAPHSSTSSSPTTSTSVSC